MEKQPQPPPLKAVLMQHLILGVKLALIAILVWTLLYGVFLLYLGVAFAKDLSSWAKQVQDNLQNSLNILEKPLQLDMTFLNNRPGATGDEDGDWGWPRPEFDATTNSDPIHPKFPKILKNEGHAAAVVWKLGFDKELIQGLSNSLIKKTNNSQDAEELCASHGYTLEFFGSVLPNTYLDWKDELVDLVQWFYPSYNFTLTVTLIKEVQIVKSLGNGDGTGRISPRTECMAFVYGWLVETDYELLEKFRDNSFTVQVAEGHGFKCCVEMGVA